MSVRCVSLFPLPPFFFLEFHPDALVFGSRQAEEMAAEADCGGSGFRVRFSKIGAVADQTVRDPSPLTVVVISRSHVAPPPTPFDSCSVLFVTHAIIAFLCQCACLGGAATMWTFSCEQV